MSTIPQSPSVSQLGQSFSALDPDRADPQTPEIEYDEDEKMPAAASMPPPSYKSPSKPTSSAAAAAHRPSSVPTVAAAIEAARAAEAKRNNPTPPAPAFSVAEIRQLAAQHAVPIAVKPISLPREALLCGVKRRDVVSFDDVNAVVTSFEELYAGFAFDRKSIAGRALARGNKDRQILATERKLAKLKREKEELEALRAADASLDELYAEQDAALETHSKIISTRLAQNKRQKQVLKQQVDYAHVDSGNTDAPHRLRDYTMRPNADGSNWELHYQPRAQ